MRIDVKLNALLLYSFLLFPFINYAQLDTSRHIKEEGWIEGMDDYIGLKLSLNNAIETFHVNVEADDYQIDLYPNTSTSTKIHFNYRFISFNIRFAPSFLPGNDDEFSKGKTISFGMSAGLNFRHWFHDFSLSRTQGYYINNSKDFSAYVPGGPYLQLPALVVSNIEGTSGYSFNPKFSVKSLTTQTERQIKSAGSFIPLLTYRHYIVNNKDMNATSTQRADNLEFVLGAGYYYTLVVKHNFYFSLGATPGIGYIFTTLNTRFQNVSPTNVVSYSNAPIFRFDGRGAAGYNGRSFFAGCTLNFNSMSFEQEGTTAVNVNTRSSYQIFAGVRLNAPKPLRDKASIIDKMIK